MKNFTLACVVALAAASAQASAAPATSGDVLAGTKRLLLPMIVKSYGGTCSGDLAGPVTVSADGVLSAGTFKRDLMARPVALEVGHDVVGGKPGPASFDARVFGEFNAKLVQNAAEVVTVSAGESKAECRFKRSATASGNPRLYPLLAALTANVALEMGCIYKGGKPGKYKLALTPGALSIDGELINLVPPDGKEEITVHDSGLIYSLVSGGSLTMVSFDPSGQLKEVSATVRGKSMGCIQGL